MRSYFITGGTGFIGRGIVRALLKRDDTEVIVCLTRGRDELMRHPKIRYLFGDVTEVAFPEAHFTDLIHAAGEANDLLQPDQPAYYYTIVEGARRVFEWAHKQQIYRTLFVSSGVVFKGDTIYCRAKRLSEWLMGRTLPSGRIARVFSVVGEEMPIDGQYALGRFIAQGLKGNIQYYESGSVRSYLHIDDCAQWLLTILERGHPNRPYDVGASRPITIANLAHLVGKMMGVPVEEIPCERHELAKIYLPDAAATRALGVMETVSLEESIRRTIDHIRNTDLEPSAAG